MLNVLKHLDKYYIYAVSSKKPILLASSNSKTKLREQTLDKLELKNNIPQKMADKYDGIYLFRIKLMKVPKKEINSDKKSEIKMIGGPIVAIIERIQINIKDKAKLKSIDNDSVNNKIYISSVYLKKYETIKSDTIDKIAFDFAHKKFNAGLFAVNTINE